MYLKIACISNNIYLKVKDEEEAEKLMFDLNEKFKIDKYIAVKSNEYNCILYYINILGLYIISDESYYENIKNKPSNY